MEWLSLNAVLSICLGVSLAAACGFRIFAPFLVASGAALFFDQPLGSGFTWLGSWPAFATLAVATVLEIAAYYVPWVDNVLDACAAPVAVLGGIIITASTMTEVSPLVKWTMAIVAGGGAAGLTHASTAAVRAASTALTGGLANWVVNTIESIGAFVVALLAMILPVLIVIAVVVMLVVLVIMAWHLRRRLRLRRAAAPAV